MRVNQTKLLEQVCRRTGDILVLLRRGLGLFDSHVDDLRHSVSSDQSNAWWDRLVPSVMADLTANSVVGNDASAPSQIATPSVGLAAEADVKKWTSAQCDSDHPLWPTGHAIPHLHAAKLLGGLAPRRLQLVANASACPIDRA